MKQKVYAIYDKAAETYHRPFVEATDQLAIRAFCQAWKPEEKSFQMFADDYVLYYLGTFENEQGFFESEDTNRKIFDGQMLRKMYEEHQ